MTKILVECPQKIASVRVGVLEPMLPLEESGQCQIRYRDTNQIKNADISWCDILICVRGCEYPTLCVVQAAKRAKRFVVYFLDDDLLNIPDGLASTNYYRDNKIKANLTQIIELSDVLWAVNQQIICKYKHYVARSVLSCVPAKVLQKPKQVAGKIHILYAGSVDHSNLIQELLTLAVQKVLKEYPGKVDFTFIGANLGLQHSDGVIYYPYFDSYDEYQEMVLSGNFSVGLAPVYDSPFYACKYYNKFIEYSKCGIAGIYSDCEPYRQIIKHGKNGLLCKNTVEDWYSNIKQLVENPRQIEMMAKRGEDMLLGKFNHQTIAQALKTQLPELVSFQAPKIPENEVRLPPMKWLFYQERILLLCREYRLLAIFVIPLKTIRKLWKVIRKNVKRLTIR